MDILKSFDDLNIFIELIPDLVFIKDTEGKYKNCNQVFLNFFKQKKEEVIGKTDFEIFSKVNAQKFHEIDKKIFKTEKKATIIEKFIHTDSSISYFETTKEPLYEKGEKIALFCIAKNITQKKEYEIIYNDNKSLLEYIAIKNNLSKILDKIVKLAENRNPNTKCSILILDKSKRHLIKGSAPSLPNFYNKAINGVKIGEKVGSCGSAAYKKQRVIVSDINSHENWQAYLELTNKANLHACWSEPIFSSNNEILGTFAIYNSSPKAPSDFELKLINSYAHLASVAIEKANTNSLFKEKENEILKNELLTRNIIDSTPNLVWLKDINGKYILCNYEFEKFFGKKEEQIIGKTDYDFVDEELATFFRERDKKAMNSEIAVVNEEWVTYKTNNKKVLLETTKKALKDANGDYIGILGIGHDITKRYKKEKELKKLNQFAKLLTTEQSTLLSLFDKGNEVLFKWKKDSTFSVEYLSSSIKNLMGYEKEDFLNGKIKYSSCIYKEDLKHLSEEIKNLLKNNLDYYKHKVYRILTKDNKTKYILQSSITQRNSKGTITHIIGYITDITEQKEQEEILYQQSKMISIIELLGNISHQWRQPLSVVTTLATGCKIKKELGLLQNDEFCKSMDTINENAQYLSKIIDDFRSFIIKEKRAVDFKLTSAIESYLTILSSLFIQNNIFVIKNFDDSIVLHNYENNLKRALINITNNSIDALKNIKGDKFIFISTKKEEDNIIITIKDNAGGIDEKIINSIFEPYTTTKYNSLGTGLGLNIAYTSIASCNGEIKIKNSTYNYKDETYTGALFTINISNKV